VYKCRRISQKKAYNIQNTTKVCNQEQHFTNLVLEHKPVGGRNKGKPALRWMEDVELELRDMSVRIWRTSALDRTEWASVLREIDAVLKGL
jgi:hypothetical protein